MTDDIWKRGEVASPCTKVCVIHPEAKICIGCYRTGAEISDWSHMQNDARLALMEQLPARAKLLTKRRGGRAKRQERERANSTQRPFGL